MRHCALNETMRQNALLGIAWGYMAFVSCSPPSASAYMVNMYPDTIHVRLAIQNRERFNYFSSLRLTYVDSELKKGQSQTAPLKLDSNALVISFEIPAHTAAMLSGVGPFRSYSLRRDCGEAYFASDADTLEYREYMGRRCADVLLYSLSSLTVQTPDGQIALTGLQIPMAFRRRDSLRFVFELNPDISEFKDPPRTCCVF